MASSKYNFNTNPSGREILVQRVEKEIVEVIRAQKMTSDVWPLTNCSLFQGYNLYVLEENKKLKASKVLIQETARNLRRKIDQESQTRMDALFTNMKKTVEDTHLSLVEISKLEETLQNYTRDLGVIISGKISFKITRQSN